MRLALVALLAAVLIAPAAAAAQSSPFAPLPPAPPPPAPQTAPTAPSSPGAGISGVQQAFLIATGLLLVLGIGFAITRDARRNAPAQPRAGKGGSTTSAGTDGGVGERKKPDPRAAQKQKAAAKRARQARKRNRPVRK